MNGGINERIERGKREMNNIEKKERTKEGNE